ncbi:MAG: hypothetical protein UT11_C0048G0004 [Berkelbacteria bacterium GW2011_GWA2_38_9]|uniref:TRAM domain-containing protein n=1 Tax=Berkelbacteria bacterium GW2011_GWA2_38_9 TaxID=1618334 RepID=A0A0G0L6M1_9BACT|nr:MAG: hypothetical protein UT11_C0048G0004 [Berkelbacteria bacterium GW2011_GWA2_38_9]
MKVYDLFIEINNTQFPLFLMILVLSVIVLISVRYLLKISAPYFFLGMVGLILGIVIGSILSSPLTKLPGSIGVWFPPIVNIFITIAVLDLFLAQGKALSKILVPYLNKNSHQPTWSDNIYVIDTSILIDGRIRKIVEIDFLIGKYLLSSLVIKELRRLADENNEYKKIRGQRGLDVLSSLTKHSKITLEIVNQHFSKSVDDSLVELAKNHHAQLLTADVALMKVAEIANVRAMSIAELADSLKPMMIPGEELEIHIIEKGKTKYQGIGYLADGTMVVVRDGHEKIGQTVNIRVEKIHQTTTGTIIFAEMIYNQIK